MNVVNITPENISELIANELLYLSKYNGVECPVGKDDHEVLSYANSYCDRLAEVSDIDYILNHSTKTVYVTFEQKSPALSSIIQEGIFA